jgi:hypothetical protein
VTFDWSVVPGATLFDEANPGVVQGLMRGQAVILYGGSRGVATDAYVYNLMIKGSPPVLMPASRAPRALVEDSLTENPKEVGPRGVDWDAVEGSTIDVAPTAWHVTLTGGEPIVVYAHRYRREGGEYLFTLPLQGGRIQLPMARISDHLVAAVAEGPPLD